MRFRLFFLLLTSPLLAEAPWGKDAFISPSTRSKAPKAIHALIRFHQKIISPADGPRSHFTPSSSSYSYQAFAKYGFLKGYLMTCDRLMRENSEPWVYPIFKNEELILKWDPVP